MKAAIPLFKNRVSPNFSTAQEVLLVQAEGGRVCATWKIDLTPLSVTERRVMLLNLGIDTIFCGGIDEMSHIWLGGQGILVIDNQMGDAVEILDKYLNTSIK